MVDDYYLSGWWYTYPSENMKVNWDNDIPNIWNNKSHVPNHQPDIICQFKCHPLSLFIHIHSLIAR